MAQKEPIRTIIMGAAGRDFHNFNVVYRDNPLFKVVAFTASQIPNIDNRVYPPELAGKLYPNGIPIYPEEKLEELIRRYSVEEVVLSYSDLLFDEVMEKASRILAAGASFKLLGVKQTMLTSTKPVIAVTGSRTGAGKSTVSRKITKILKKFNVRFVVVRHPMPYGSLQKMVVQRFTTLEDLDRYECTIEEREEYEPHLLEGNVVYAGVDYTKILKEAEREADLILWDGGNNDWPFFKPSLYITVVDPLRPGHELRSYPGLINILLADVIVINKINVAEKNAVDTTVKNVKRINSNARIIFAESEVIVNKPGLIKGKRVLVVEDGPTVTHGSLGFAAGYMAAKKYKALKIVDPRSYAVGSIKDVYNKYPHIGPVLPTMGYGREQMKELEETINNVPADVVILGTPSDISRYLNINKPVVKTLFKLREVSKPTLEDIISVFLKEKKLV